MSVAAVWGQEYICSFYCGPFMSKQTLFFCFREPYPMHTYAHICTHIHSSICVCTGSLLPGRKWSLLVVLLAWSSEFTHLNILFINNAMFAWGTPVRKLEDQRIGHLWRMYLDTRNGVVHEQLWLSNPSKVERLPWQWVTFWAELRPSGKSKTPSRVKGLECRVQVIIHLWSHSYSHAVGIQ